MLRALILFLFFFITIGPLFSQTRGLVLDGEENPISKVSVYLVDQQIKIQTNQEGVFTTDKNLPNNSFLEFYKLGYESVLIQYQIGQTIKISLKKLHVELDEVGIEESFNVLGNSKLINIEKKSLSNNFMASTSLVESVSELPGVNSIGSGLGIQKVVIRGLSGLRVVTYLNGMRISNQEWGNDHGLGFTELGIEKVELIKGASSLSYGADAIGGVLYFQDVPFSKSHLPSGFVSTKFDNSHFLFGNQFGLKWSRKSLYFNIYGEHSVASDYRLPDNTYLFNSRFRNTALKLSVARLGVKIQNIFRYQYNSDQVGIPAHAHGNLNNITLESITSSSLDFNEDFEATRPTQYINNHLFTFETNYFSNKIKYTLFGGYFLNNLQEFEKWTIATFDMNLANTTLRLNLEFPLKNFNVNSGIQYHFQDNFNNISSRLIPDSQSSNFGVYTVVDYEKNNFGFSSGVRLDYQNIECQEFSYSKLFSAFNSSFGVFYKKNDHLARLTYSGSYRTPHLSELFSNGLHHGTMRFEIGNINLNNEKSHQFDIKYQWSNDHFGVVVNPFVQLVNDFISINPTDVFYEGVYRIYNYEQFDNVQMSGFEMNIHYHPHVFHNLHIEQSYSFINALNKDNNRFLAMTPSNKIKTKLIVDLNQYKIPLGIKTFSIYHLYSFVQENIALYESPSSYYNILNMDILFSIFKNMSLVVGVNNMLNEEYIPHLSRIKEVAGGVPHPGRSFHISLKYDF